MRIRTMAVTGAIAAALCAGAALVGPAVEAAPGDCPYQGEFEGQAGEPYPIAWDKISISAGGRMAGSDPTNGGTGKFSGTVSDDGAYSLSGSAKSSFFLPPGKARNWVRPVRPADALPGGDDAEKPSAVGTYTFTQSGTMSLGTDGNLYVTNSAGVTFVWIRK